MLKFSIGGGYFGVNFGHLKSEVFLWGVFWSKLWSSQIQSFPLGGGGILELTLVISNLKFFICDGGGGGSGL